MPSVSSSQYKNFKNQKRISELSENLMDLFIDLEDAASKSDIKKINSEIFDYSITIIYYYIKKFYKNNIKSLSDEEKIQFIKTELEKYLDKEIFPYLEDIDGKNFKFPDEKFNDPEIIEEFKKL